MFRFHSSHLQSCKGRATILVVLFCILSTGARAQNIGIGTSNPGSRLDVNGDINTSGQLKLNGQAGLPNQVLSKDALNNPVWVDLSEFKNFIVFDCFNIAGSGSNDCSYSWTVPANVSTILVECWGGGGGGGSTAGGGGGGYIIARYTVAAGDNALIQVGAGGKGFILLGAAGTSGGTSFFRINGNSVFASGGSAGSFDIWASSFNVVAGVGGSFLASGLAQNYMGWNGESGNAGRKHFEQLSPTAFAQVLEYGSGGDAGKSIGSGGKGGWYYSDGSVTQVIHASAEARYPGGGGGADFNAGGNGKGGRVVIRW